MAIKQNERVDVYQRVTDQIIQAIEAGVDKWEMPWHAPETSFRYPTNIESGKQYRGINVLGLWASSYLQGFQEPVWGTFKQWSDKGLHVRKGEKATIGVFWKQLQPYEQAELPSGDEPEGSHGPSLVARAFPLFNAQQIEGYQAPPLFETPHVERIQRAEEFFAALGADIRHGGGKAFFQPEADYIQMPPFEAFFDPVAYYATLAHEATHWSGHKSRLDRDLKGRFGSESYAAEELIAELGAAFIAADLELTSEARPENAAYVQSWLTVLRKDNRAIFTAASHAQRAADFMHSLQTTTAPLPATTPNRGFVPEP